MIIVRIDDHEAMQLFDRMRRKSADLTAPNNEIGAIGLASIIKNFEVGGRYGTPGDWRGGPHRWKALKAQTLLARNTRWATRKNKDGAVVSQGFKTRPERMRKLGILQNSARLRNSITWRATADSVKWGTNLVYAAIQNIGGKTKAHVIRPRHKKALAWPGMTGHPVKQVRHPGSKIDARPYLVIQTEDLVQIKAVMQKFLLSA